MRNQIFSLNAFFLRLRNACVNYGNRRTRPASRGSDKPFLYNVDRFLRQSHNKVLGKQSCKAGLKTQGVQKFRSISYKGFSDEIIVDCYGQVERAMGWYYHLEDNLDFPFTAKCILKRQTSSLKTVEVVEVTGMATEDECEHEMFVKVRWQKRVLAVPLIQLGGIKVNKETRESIGAWHYWVKRGYVL